MSDFLKRLSRDPYAPIDAASITRVDELGNGYDDFGQLIAPAYVQPEQTWGEAALGVATAPARIATALAGSLSPYGAEGWQVPPIVSEGVDALTAVGDAYTGKMAPEDVNARALGMAGFMMGGGGLAARPTIAAENAGVRLSRSAFERSQLPIDEIYPTLDRLNRAVAEDGLRSKWAAAFPESPTWEEIQPDWWLNNRNMDNAASRQIGGDGDLWLAMNRAGNVTPNAGFSNDLAPMSNASDLPGISALKGAERLATPSGISLDYLDLLNSVGPGKSTLHANASKEGAAPALLDVLSNAYAPDNQLNMFGGRNAKTANLERLAIAERMAADGADRRAIWDQTGWFKGPDQKWRFEIDDSQAGFNVGGEYPWKVSNALNHPDLAAAYPDVPGISIARSQPTGSAVYHEATDHIGLGANPHRMDGSNLLHEIQHGIQKREQFARGQNPDNAFKSYLDRYNDLGDMIAVYTRNEMLGEPLEQAADYVARVRGKEPGGLRYMLQTHGSKDELIAKQDQIRAENGGTVSPHEWYRRHAGEVEARNVQKRMNMSADERRATPPWETQDIPDADQIVRLYSNADSRPALLAEAPHDTEDGYADGGRVGLPSPYSVAKSMIGQREGRGNDLLNRFLNGDTAGMTSAEYAWCSRFVKQAAAKAGVDVAKATDMARSWLDVGQPVDKPAVGDVVVLSRGNPNSQYGHVGFYEGTNPDGSVRILSGNHNNAVASGSYPASRVLGYRRLDGQPEAYDPATGQQGLKPLAMMDGVGRELPALPAPTPEPSTQVVEQAKPSFDFMKVASLFAQPEPEQAPQVQFTPIQAFQAQGSPIEASTPYRGMFAHGGQVRGLPDQSEPIHAGPLHSTVPGRTDHLPIIVAAGSFVLPADIVSSLGEGNTNAGMEAVSKMFPLPPVRRADGGRVPIAAAGGEFVIAPETVAAVGNGDMETGHELLDQFVRRTRAQNIQRLRALPGPEK